MATEEVLVHVMQADFLFVIVDNKGYPKETLKAVSKSVNRELRHAINRARAARAVQYPDDAGDWLQPHRFLFIRSIEA